MQKVLRAQENGKRGPFTLAGGVQVHLWEDWTLIVPRTHVFNETRPSFELRLWTKTEFETALETKLSATNAPAHAPFWVAFEPEQNGRNVLVASGRDVSWPSLTSDGDLSVISAFKLLKRWRDAELRLQISPLW